jgi:hypothetical protein
MKSSRDSRVEFAFYRKFDSLTPKTFFIEYELLYFVATTSKHFRSYRSTSGDDTLKRHIITEISIPIQYYQIQIWPMSCTDIAFNSSKQTITNAHKTKDSAITMTVPSTPLREKSVYINYNNTKMEAFDIC